ncbi:hypothetical protein [Sandaracinus amylolyticus]|uniref:hypothetical protein n=1 Tax=Sandaracinus amylolyticus TaxID=927083 RepID=UPI001F224491|nr:hypothetical protein [Sandaracinus amylolyticus]UJR82567.1 Hypothetical protein I5071_46320 [Sandaracinus amylolyticus]
MGTCSRVLFALALVGCAESGEGRDAPREWQGEATHVDAVGTIDGLAVDFDLDASDAAEVFCERNYVVPDVDDPATWSSGYLEKVEVKWLVVVDGTEREYQLELSAHDFGASADGQTLSIVGYEEGAARAPTTIQVAADAEWEEDGSEREHVSLSGTGTFVRGVVTGTPGGDGVVVPDGQGTFGGYLHLESAGGESLDVSFTVPCGDNDLDIGA